MREKLEFHTGETKLLWREATGLTHYSLVWRERVMTFRGGGNGL